MGNIPGILGTGLSGIGHAFLEFSGSWSLITQIFEH